MKIKSNIFVLILFFFFSCSTNKQDEANKIIADFVFNNKIDKRETILEVDAIFENGNLILKGETDQPELKSKLLSTLRNIKTVDQIILLPDSTVDDKIFGLVNLSVANLRSEPTHSAELATQALMGTPVKILRIKNGWFLIQTPDKYISWVDSEGIFPITKLQLDDWKDSKRLIFTGDNGTVYESVNFENPVSDLTTGNILVEAERNQKAVKIKFPDGRIGFSDPSNWINFNDFKNTIQPDSIQLKNLAKQLMGRPYLWGGTSARAMDCSGFVKTLYFMNGVILARDASLQFEHGKVVEPDNGFSNIETGDLLFFGQKPSESQDYKITHVALSLGNTEFIHASGKIERNSFNPESRIFSEYRKNSFAGAKRIMGFENTEGIQTIKNHPWY